MNSPGVFLCGFVPRNEHTARRLLPFIPLWIGPAQWVASFVILLSVSLHLRAFARGIRPPRSVRDGVGQRPQGARW